MTTKNQSARLPEAPRPTAEVAARPEPPGTILTAVKLMYAGAALTAIGVVLTVVAIAAGAAVALRASHKHATLAQIHATQGVLITAAIFSGLVEIALWIFVARANRGGLGWARILATVLFALNTWIMSRQFFGPIAVAGLIGTGLTWLAGLGAVYYLWRKESTAYFAA